jgi:hypothetical protein
MISQSETTAVVIGSETEVRYFQQGYSRTIRLDEARVEQVGSRMERAGDERHGRGRDRDMGGVFNGE